MNGIEKITARIQADADAAKAALLKKAEQEADALLDEYRQKARAEYETLRTEGELAAKSQKEQLISAARLEVNKQLLQTRQELMAQAFEKATEELRALPADRYLLLLTRLAVSASRTGKEELIFNEADRARYGEQAVASANAALAATGKPAGLTLSDSTRPLDGGLVLKDGRIEVNCSLSSLIDTRRDELAVEVSRILFR
ncbi:MAG: V-type ATP synthase subunit E [Oscillospiraceae bacterium]|nr:V-type ATP synthase subunit E [Oscillospiraceae bacterium]